MTKSFPVKYMVVAGTEFYLIVDTSYNGNGRIVGFGDTLEEAEEKCKKKNTAEGYVYLTSAEREAK